MAGRVIERAFCAVDLWWPLEEMPDLERVKTSGAPAIIGHRTGAVVRCGLAERFREPTPFTCQDGRLITGQNPASLEPVAKLLLSELDV